MSAPAPASPFPAPTPAKPRPSAWWFAVGGVLLIAGVAIGVTALVITVSRFSHVDATVPADGRSTTVSLTAGQEYLAWYHVDQGAHCSFVANATGDVVVTHGLGSTSYHRSGSSGEWTGITTFTAPRGGVDVTCQASGGPIQIGPKPHFAAFLGGIALTILAPLVLGLAGIAVLVVTTILFVVRSPKRRGPTGPFGPGFTPAS